MTPPAFLLAKAHLWMAHRLERWLEGHLAEAMRIAEEYRRRLDMCHALPGRLNGGKGR